MTCTEALPLTLPDEHESWVSEAEPDSRQLDVLTTFGALEEPLCPHLDELRRILAEAEPFDDPDAVQAETCYAILAEGRTIQAAAGPEGLVFAVATMADEGGERASLRADLMWRAWSELPGCGSIARN